MNILKAMENPWSSSSKIKTSCERGGKRLRKGMQKSNLAHVGLFDTRGCTCVKVNSIKAKRWVTLRYEFVKKGHQKNNKKTEQTKNKKQLDVAVAFRSGALQNRGSCVGAVTISRICHENDD